MQFSQTSYRGQPLHDLAWSIRKLASYKPQRQISGTKDMQLTVPCRPESLTQTAPDVRSREVHAVLTESQRGHHYLEGLDLLAWGGCHLGLSLQLDSSDTTLLLRTGTGRAWNVSGKKWTTRHEIALPLVRGGKSFKRDRLSLYWNHFVEDKRMKDMSPLSLY